MTHNWGETVGCLCLGILLFALAYGAGQLLMMFLLGW